jgi:hypothetical protein
MSHDKVAAFAFGTVFIALLLFMVKANEKISPEAFTIFRIILALAAGGIGAVVPGVLDVRMKGFLRAGGAMGMFAVVYFFSPPAPNVGRELGDIPPDPVVPAEGAIQTWFAFTDTNRFADAWAVAASSFKKSHPREVFIGLLAAQRTPLGQSITRVPHSLYNATQLPGGARGNFRFYSYQTKFSSGQELVETLLLSVEDAQWRVAGHIVAPLPSATAGQPGGGVMVGGAK